MGNSLALGENSKVYAEKELRILCLGDSTTVQGGGQSYPAQLERILNKNGKRVRFRVINAGKAEATTSDIADVFSDQIERYAPDMAVVMMGINDGFLRFDYSKFTRMGWSYKEKGQRAAAIESFQKAIALNPAGYREHTEFGIFYLKSGEYAQAQRLLRKAVDINRYADEAYIVLGWCYLGQNRPAEAEMSFKKAMELNPRNPDISGGLAILCEQNGDYDSARVYYEKANLLRLSHNLPGSKRNFKRVRSIAARHRVPLMCVQYPMRSAALLRRMVGRLKKDVIVVDNEEVFKKAVREHGYREYFEDMFAGESGHCTAEGNRLLADTVAASILKYYAL